MTIEIKKLIRVAPIRTEQKMDNVVTTRFTETEKEEIDLMVKEYATTQTDFVRNAVFYYIKTLKIKEQKKAEEIPK